MTRALPILLLALACHSRTEAAPKPCGAFFVSGPGPVAWMSGVWTGSARANGGASEYQELVWTALTGGTMSGMARRYTVTQHAPDHTLAVDFFMIRQEPGGKLVYVEQAGAATPRVFDLVEGRDGFAVFAHQDGTRVTVERFKDGAGRLDLRREHGKDVLEWRLWRDM
jgi:Domain of unknown function (DUF6265)